MFEKDIVDYFSKFPFNNKKYPILMNDCKDEGCELKGNFDDFIILNGDYITTCLKKDEKSVDFIVFSKKITNNKVDVLLCELTTGNKCYNDVLEKIKCSGEYIVKIFQELGYSVRNFDCIFLGRYKNDNRPPLTQGFSISGCSRNDLKIRRFDCGQEISEIKNLSFNN